MSYYGATLEVEVNVNRSRNANSEKTHCPLGHLYDEVNTYILKTSTGTGRLCKACARKSQIKTKEGV